MMLTVLYAVVFVLSLFLLYDSISRLVKKLKVHAKLQLVIDEIVADPAHFEEMDHMVPQMLDDLPNREVLKWADDFILDAMQDDFSIKEKAMIYEGLRQTSVDGRWAFVKKFLLEPYKK